jgi:hypothetical protein
LAPIDSRHRHDSHEAVPTISRTQEETMNAKPPRSSPLSVIAAAALAAFIAIGLLASVVALFQLDGAPLELLVRAERDCTQHFYVSERDACIRELLAAVQASSIASK